MNFLTKKLDLIFNVIRSLEKSHTTAQSIIEYPYSNDKTHDEKRVQLFAEIMLDYISEAEETLQELIKLSEPKN